ncbi:hypothetical protein [Filimonas effusa]|uniref:Uncharacterized protein n=1 Tax=Filimonas effusa TaxID=2508721 RepID=A0A4Q1DB66_9BACT|nr:hypothetical protein [Filimonas effusa]RXK86530.1 hypothetical protein ESB13_06915 [Filimonas effusa]
MTSISKSEHEKMQVALEQIKTEGASQMRQELATLHSEFVRQLEAARESVVQYEKHYKAARLLLAKAVKEHKKEMAKKMAGGVIHVLLIVAAIGIYW